MRHATILVAMVLLLSGCETEPEKKPANESFRVLFETTRGNFIFRVHPEWAPNGAERFRTLVENDFHDGTRTFRLIRIPRKFAAQLGISGDPETGSKWRANMIQGDPVKTSIPREAISFAMAEKNSRTTQVFINYGDNSDLDDQYPTPFGLVEEGMDVADRFYSGDGDRPAQDTIHLEGNAYLDEYFPKRDRIRRASILVEES